MAAINITDKYKAIQYTGSNSAEFDAEITQLDIISETGGVLTVESPPSGGTFNLSVGEWARYTQGAIVSKHTNTEFLNFYIRNAIYDDFTTLSSTVTTLQGQVNTVSAAGARSVGVRDTPTLIGSGNTVVAVTITPAMPSSSYTASAMLFGPVAVLATLSITTVAVVNTTTVNVTVQNTGLVGLTAHLLVVAKT